MKLTGKVAIITGGGTGIGAATATLFAAEGARVCVFGRRPEPLNATVAAIQAAGGTAMAVSGSVTSAADCQRLVDETGHVYGRVDNLVTSAGVATLMAFNKTTEELWDNVLNTNLKGLFLSVGAVAPVMLQQKSGSIVAVSSILGQVGFKGAAAYCAAKGGVNQLVRALAVEYAEQGIRVNAVAPGWVETPMTESVQAHPALFEFLRSRHPMGRFGAAEEVAQAILYLASDDARWVTGSILNIDGGWTTW